MIIPMTLLNNTDLSEAFREHFHIPQPPKSGEINRAIYGFLCFDHIDTDYFVEDIDVPAGYIFADMISFFFFNRLNYVTYSDTLRKSMEFTGENVL
jgi:hypothetical protein